MNEQKVIGSCAISGAASGIGRSIALQLATTGMSLALFDRDERELRETAARAREAGAAEAPAIPVDVADESAVAAAFEQAEVLGALDGLVSAAGTLMPGGLTDTTSAAWRRHLDVNATGVFHMLHFGAPRLRDGASVVVISSNAARVPRTGMIAYAASKAAASAATRCAGLELAARRIRCNVIEPGSTDTPMQRALWPDAELGAAHAVHGNAEEFRVGIPLGRVGDPGEVAELACFLLSDASRHITLQQIYVDGGASL